MLAKMENTFTGTGNGECDNTGMHQCNKVVHNQKNSASNGLYVLYVTINLFSDNQLMLSLGD